MRLNSRKSVGVLLASLCGIFFVCSGVSAATIYVNSVTGDDGTGDGSSGNPYKTFHQGYTSASASDTLNLTGTFTWTDAAETGDAASSGYTIGKNLTVVGQGAASTIIQSLRPSRKSRIIEVTMPKDIIIQKSNGDTAVFSQKKVVQSLRRAGAAKSLANDIAQQVTRQIKPDMRTSDVYRIAFGLLKKYDERPLAARYSLKQAILSLGPTGYSFERFVGELLNHHGYQTKVGIMMKGTCVNHEVDVFATKGNEQHIIECKFHNQIGYQTNVRVPLYVRSRFLDIERELKRTGRLGVEYTPWIVTNTQFTKDAIKYGECMKMKLIGWRYPKTGGLEKLIEETGLHPLTCLTTLTNAQKTVLLKQNVVLCKDVVTKPGMMRNAGITGAKADAVISEAQGVCKLV